MKYVKMLGLAAAAVAALMAFVGASTASATVLCKVEGEKGATGLTGTTCPAEKAYPKGTEIHAVLDPGTGPAKLTTAFKNIECEESTVSGKTSNEGSATETVTGSVEVLTFGKCNCEVNVIKKGTLEVHWINVLDKNENGEVIAETGGHNGTLTSNGAEVTAQCNTIFGAVHCIYVTENTDLGTATASGKNEKGEATPATMDIESANIPRLATSGLCAETAKWDAKYEVTSPKPLYVAAHT